MKRIEELRHSLAAKVTILIVGILIIGFSALLILNIRRDREERIAKYLETANLLSESMITSIEGGMIEARPDIIRRLVQDMKARLKGVRRINVYRRNGIEAFTDLETVDAVDAVMGLETGIIERISKMRRETGPRISHPLFTQAVETMKPQHFYEMVGDGRVLTLFRPLLNQAECQDCHGEDHEVRGVVRVSLGLERLDAELRSSRNRQVIVALLIILGVIAAVMVFMGRVVLRPIARVAEIAQRIGGGDFDARVPVDSQDEIGQLGTVINDMTKRLMQAHGDIETKNKALDETLHNLRDSMKRVELLEQLKGELSKFVPESVKRLLEQNPDASELEKKEKDVSVLFLDIAGYTRLSEQMEPRELNRLIQSYFSSFLESIQEHQGDVNETAGDGLMVIFPSDRSSTEHALNAVHSAFAIRHRVEELNEQFAGVFQPVLLHMGINSGLALVGATKMASSAGARWTFTASGQVTNQAARIAGQATEGEILVGPTTAERIKGEFVLEDLGERSLKNVTEPVRLYRVVPPGVYERVEHAG